MTARMLSPIGAVYGALASRRMARPGTVIDAPVLCVGNLVVGGAGKTPVTIAFAETLAAEGRRPAVLSRGYGGRAARRGSVLRVDPARHDAAETGDEPLLLAAVAPTYVGADRVASARRALLDGARVILLDDGLQNSALAKTFSLAVVDGTAGIGNGLCLPAGPMRAPLERQWPYVSALCLVGDGPAGDALARAAAQRSLPVLRAKLKPDAGRLAGLIGQPVYAFAGIGRPAKFFATLRAHGVDVVGQQSFPDHHAFSASDLKQLEQSAAKLAARLVTTTKDRVRMPQSFPASDLPVRLVFDDPSAVLRSLEPTWFGMARGS